MTLFAHRTSQAVSRSPVSLGLLCAFLLPLIACGDDPAPANRASAAGTGGKQAGAGGAAGTTIGGAGNGGAGRAGASGTTGGGGNTGEAGKSAAGHAGAGAVAGGGGQPAAGSAGSGGAAEAGASGAGGAGLSGQAGASGAGSAGTAGQGGNAGSSGVVTRDVATTSAYILSYGLHLSGSTWHVGYLTGSSPVASTLHHAASSANSSPFVASPIVHAGYVRDWSFDAQGPDARFTFADENFNAGIFQASNQPTAWTKKALRISTQQADTGGASCARGPNGTMHCVYLVGPYGKDPTERRYLRVDPQGVVSDELVDAGKVTTARTDDRLVVTADGTLFMYRHAGAFGQPMTRVAERRDPKTGAWSAIEIASGASLGDAVLSPDGVAHFFTVESVKDSASDDTIVVVSERTHTFPATDATPKAEVWRSPPGFENAREGNYLPVDGSISATFVMKTDFDDKGKSFNQIRIVPLGAGPSASSRLVVSEPYGGDRLEMPQLIPTPKGLAVSWIREVDDTRTIVLAENP